MKLIDKDKIVAEIERIKKEECPTDSYEGRCKLLWFEQFLSFINTLEVKEVDLEKELKSYCKEYYNCNYPKQVEEGNCAEVMPHIVSTAKHFFKLGLKTQKGE